MKDIRLMEVNGMPRQVEISPAFIQIIEEVNSIYTNARSKIITNIIVIEIIKMISGDFLKK